MQEFSMFRIVSSLILRASNGMFCAEIVAVATLSTSVECHAGDTVYVDSFALIPVCTYVDCV